jgi:hypothetical protein
MPDSAARQLARRNRRSPSGSQSEKSPQLLFHTPTSDDEILSSLLVSKLNINDDLRFHLSWAYGGFFDDLPSRIGSNEALDAAVDALVSAHSRLTLANRASVPDLDGLGKYTHAVTTLRVSLNDPIKAREANTLCAVWLLMICQVSHSLHTLFNICANMISATLR